MMMWAHFSSEWLAGVIRLRGSTNYSEYLENSGEKSIGLCQEAESQSSLGL